MSVDLGIDLGTGQCTGLCKRKRGCAERTIGSCI